MMVTSIVSLGLMSSLLAALTLAPSAQGEPLPTADAGTATVRIALRSHLPALQTLAQWQPTADYLASHLPGYRVELVPFENLGMELEAVSRGHFDFVLSNPSSYVEYQQRYGARALVTLANRRQGQGYSKFGAALFTRADRHDINTVKDLIGKRVMVVSDRAFGGWQVAWHELRRLGVDPYNDFGTIMYAGGLQPRVVDAVLKGHADAGVVRSDMLETLEAKGVISLSEIKVLAAKRTDTYPFAHSTPLYPEWAFARFPHTDDQLANMVTRALLNMTPDLPAAKAGHYTGWQTPADYEPVRSLMEELSVGPYVGEGAPTIGKVLRTYGAWIGLVIITLIALICLLVRLKIVNNRLRDTEHQLHDLAMHDGLTGIWNRHRLDIYLDHEWRLAVRHRRPISVIMFDIDHFKQYNDHYGHVTGDDCLRKIAGLAAQHFRRANDLVVRYGGEEFLIMLQDVPAQEVRIQADALRASVSQLSLPHDQSPIAHHVTISVGAATCTPGPHNTPESLIEAADRALYQAKRDGRDRVVTVTCDQLSLVEQALG